eukprot:2616516-Amphidinium_carterae.1
MPGNSFGNVDGRSNRSGPFLEPAVRSNSVPSRFTSPVDSAYERTTLCIRRAVRHSRRSPP